MTEISIFLTIHLAVAAIWIIDSRSVQYLLGRNRYFRQFKKHEKEHQRMFSSLELELDELVKEIQEKDKAQLRAQEIEKTNRSIGLSQDTIDILNKISKNENVWRQQRQDRNKKFWPTWDDYKDIS